MYIQNNLLGLNALNNNKNNNKKLEKSINKLSTGYRINMAGDDAAGISISEKMRGQIRGIKMASKNALDANSLMQTRDGVLGEVHHMMQRMRELTVQSLNDSNTDEDRDKIQAEFKALKIGVSKITEEAEFNTMSVFEPHESSYYTFEGNNKFEDNLVRIIDGFNNDLQVSANGKITSIKIEEGYYSLVEIADIIDSKLMANDPNLIINLTENNNFSLQNEKDPSIDYIKGGLSFLFYDYHLGTPPGMIIGVTEFKENGRLNIIPGSNDKLKFYVGASKEYTINFSPKDGGYSIDELIDIINGQLKPEDEVEAIKYSDKHIALCSDKFVITGLSGNMIKIDNITSVLYDNAKYGKISKSQGYISGRKDLQAGIKIVKDNNEILKVKIDGQSEYIEINLLEEGETEKTYSLDEIINTIEDKSKDYGLGIKGEKVALGSGKWGLRLKSNYYGKESKVIVESSSSAYYDLFVSEREIIYYPDIIKGDETSASIVGEYVIEENTEIIEGENDRLKLIIDGVEKEIKLEKGNYSPQGLVDQINDRLNDLYVKVELTDAVNGKYAISITNNKIGEGKIEISQNTNAFKPLFAKPYYNILSNKPGKVEIIENQEGVVAPVEVKETPAILTGRANLKDGVTIDASNDKLNFNLSGQSINITLDHGNYNSDGLKLMLSDKLIGKPIEVSLENNPGYGTNLVFTSEEKGEGQIFKDIGGTAYKTILAKSTYSIPATISEGKNINAGIVGKSVIGNNFIIDENNNKLSFNYVVDNETYNIEIELNKETYNDSDKLLEEINTKIRAELHKIKDESGDNTLELDAVLAQKHSSSIKIEAKNPGSQYELKEFKGNFYDNVLKRKVTTVDRPYSYSGYSNSLEDQLTYLVGREDLNKEMVIHPYVNDSLIFDFYEDSQKTTFELRLNPGKYDKDSILNEIQNKLKYALTEKDLDPSMLEVQIGGVNSGTSEDDSNKLVIKFQSKNDGTDDRGNYIIDGVRGNAAYTIFYRSQGEPSPTHVIGITDLTNGANIETGVNDTFIMDLNGQEKTFVLEEKDYTSEELLEAINNKLKEIPADVVASYYEGNLKLSCLEVGRNTIDGIRGNGGQKLFFDSYSREFDLPENFQIGANSGDALSIERPRVSTELMRINTITIHKSSFANKALGRLDDAISYVSSVRGKIGAVQNRLESIINNNENYAENLTAAESRIRDLDMAKEAMKLSKEQILQNITTSMMAQANNKPEAVLKLLR